jgi:hypothetical protein
LSQQCLKLHARRPVPQHRVATWIIAHPATVTAPSVTVRPPGPSSEPANATNTAQRHAKKAVARTEPAATPARRRADLGLSERSYE